MKLFAGAVDPGQGQRQQVHHLGPASGVFEVGILEMEAPRFQATELGFHWPAVGVGVDGLVLECAEGGEGEPLSPPYCRQVLVWNESLLPAMNLAAWLRPSQPVQRQWLLAGVFGYQTRPGATPGFGALLLAGIPERVRVSDDAACALPEKPKGWRKLAISCFQHGDAAIPILDLPHLFSGGLLTAA
jgi:hypothetical protein